MDITAKNLPLFEKRIKLMLHELYLYRNCYSNFLAQIPSFVPILIGGTATTVLDNYKLLRDISLQSESAMLSEWVFEIFDNSIEIKIGGIGRDIISRFSNEYIPTTINKDDFYNKNANYNNYENLDRVELWNTHLKNNIIFHEPYIRMLLVALRIYHDCRFEYLPSGLFNRFTDFKDDLIDKKIHFFHAGHGVNWSDPESTKFADNEVLNTIFRLTNYNKLLDINDLIIYGWIISIFGDLKSVLPNTIGAAIATIIIDRSSIKDKFLPLFNRHNIWNYSYISNKYPIIFLYKYDMNDHNLKKRNYKKTYIIIDDIDPSLIPNRIKNITSIQKAVEKEFASSNSFLSSLGDVNTLSQRFDFDKLDLVKIYGYDDLSIRKLTSWIHIDNLSKPPETKNIFQWMVSKK